MSRARITGEGTLDRCNQISSAKSWVGIDVSQDWIDVVVLVEEQPAAKLRCDRSSAALAELAQTLLPYAPQGVVLEATGGLEAVVITALAAAGLPVMRMNPKRVRDFARAHGLLAKTDALDAYVLALFGARMQPLAARPGPRPSANSWRPLVTRQQQLTLQRAAERTRLHQITESQLKQSVQRVIVFLGKELARLDKQMASWMEKNSGSLEAAGYAVAHRAGRRPEDLGAPVAGSSCRNWASSTAARSPRWQAWLRWLATAAIGVAGVAFKQAGAPFAQLSI